MQYSNNTYHYSYAKIFSRKGYKIKRCKRDPLYILVPEELDKLWNGMWEAYRMYSHMEWMEFLDKILPKADKCESE